MAAILAACARQFPEVAEARVRSCIRSLLHTSHRPAHPNPLSPESADVLVNAAMRERSFIISALANSADSWPIEALSEEEVRAAIQGSPGSHLPDVQPSEADGAGQGGALPHLQGMADFAAANFAANHNSPDMGVFIRTLMTLSAMSVFPMEPSQLANSFRWVGFLLLMVAQAMESGAQASSTGESNS